MTQEVVEAAELADVVFTPIGPIELKGLLDPVHLHAARRPDRPDAST